MPLTDPRKSPSPDTVWRREKRQPRRQAAGIEQIVMAATAVADAEGLEALTMRRISKELRSSTASLYRYVAGRDELLDLMIDATLAEIELPAPSGRWQADLTALAGHLRAVMLRHPWLCTELTGRPTIGPNSLRYTDALLAAADSLTSDATTAGAMVDTVLAYTLGAAARELAELQAQRRTGLTETEWRATVAPYIREVVASERYPHFNRRVIDADDPAPEQRFAFGLDCVLEGLAHRCTASE
jgi:AcrR family transcriptional regulator